MGPFERASPLILPGKERTIAVYVTSLGCRLNQAEMAALQRALANSGRPLTDDPRAADLIVFNTCAVTAEAERKSRQALRRLRRENPRAHIVVTGCYAHLDPELGGAGPVAQQVLDNAAKRELLAHPGELLAAESATIQLPAPMTGRTRALVRVQEGCDNRCTYCVVWQLRGRQQSRSADEVLDEVRDLVGWGFREVVLTGVHIGAYGKDWDRERDLDLWGLVRRVLADSRVERLRLSSIEPWDLDSVDPALWEDRRLCRHLHLPLQSGSDRVLAAMNRRYTAAEYGDLVGGIQAGLPDMAITTDVIAGFPGETESDFQDTVALARRCGFAGMHVFPYSIRPTTPAAALPGQVPPDVIRDRAARLRAVARESAIAFADRFVGRTMPVLWEQQRGDWWTGLTSNYLRVRSRHPGGVRNQITPVRILRRDERGLVAEVVQGDEPEGEDRKS